VQVPQHHLADALADDVLHPHNEPHRRLPGRVRVGLCDDPRRACRLDDDHILPIFQELYENDRTGYASAIAWFLFLVIFILTIASWRFGGKAVHYD
jgi:hypothetical protein